VFNVQIGASPCEMGYHFCDDESRMICCAGRYTSFFLEARWDLAHGGFRFTTQASIVPMQRPFPSCQDGVDSQYNCERMV
jgi:hypothetical protein